MSDIEQRAEWLRGLKPDWDSYGAPAICRHAINESVQVAKSLSRLTTDFGLFPTSAGGVELEGKLWGHPFSLEIEPL